MKKKMIFTVVLSMWILGSLSTSTVHAAGAWYTATVVQAGYGGGSIVVALTDDGGAFTRKWFYVSQSDANTGNRLLAAIFTAISADKKLYVYVDLLSAAYPFISHIYVMN